MGIAPQVGEGCWASGAYKHKTIETVARWCPSTGLKVAEFDAGLVGV